MQLNLEDLLAMKGVIAKSQKVLNIIKNEIQYQKALFPILI